MLSLNFSYWKVWLWSLYIIGKGDWAVGVYLTDDKNKHKVTIKYIIYGTKQTRL